MPPKTGNEMPGTHLSYSRLLKVCFRFASEHSHWYCLITVNASVVKVDVSITKKLSFVCDLISYLLYDLVVGSSLVDLDAFDEKTSIKMRLD